MKYKAIIETNNYKDFEFFEDASGKYMVGKDAGAATSDEWIPLYFTKCEQESVLDKIRAEIIDTGAYEQEVRGKTEFLKGINYCLDIIDKYMGEVRNKKWTILN